MLELKNINKSFNGRPVLKNVTVTIEDGKTLAIVGPSGAGKTTLLRIISGLEQADSGTMIWNGEPTTAQAMRKQGIIGVVFQNFELFPNLSVMRNITLAPTLQGVDQQQADATAKKLLDQLALSDQAQAYPYSLSGGQKQRVAIARALALNPQILLYDEPTSALDPLLRENVAEMVNQFKASGMTQVVVTHDMDFAKSVADTTYHVGKGGDGQ
ncbi:amino acid ABC transporter ATP-binding protein [Lacticaseibacillus casei]|jgi:polar amino acid transport system ATP-binding protein|uniref:Amino acid ABC transporter ATP-binding protein n=1 Tax=Lacticaseibacillus huelsenbergensis TaxID=3035291 RepID=A0ABY8DP74_9LACO|nr:MULTISPECIES: amino acid ABC transporter ATP-binding protein [Lacticaseibacillus]MDG3061586.1 amino acid ABC transporter ATP-binding protein [Lacticaseibacillus sp. BCRC 81376]QVI37956.1 amino acid ABC transporter ATP-binding protein [Lacticaseibacillus casei]QXG59745.1 amino acid ABC transporter ATP-binding protein [Lacticaseibacillus casei]WFB38790.1 amino acid ABC transporter ATP-binding protein [Lacticaseibacillus huelsenbergensis]WFB43183.1 amino acid ABC transporter ATP-binding protei